MPEQSYAKHGKFVPVFHFFLAPLTIATVIGSFINLRRSMGNHAGLYSASLIAALAVALLVTVFLARIFPLRAQDRVIRTEENLRHYILTGQLLDRRLTVKQIVGLRFASDAEFPALAQRAAAENMSLDAIKRSVKDWRPDHDRL